MKRVQWAMIGALCAAAYGAAAHAEGYDIDRYRRATPAMQPSRPLYPAMTAPATVAPATVYHALVSHAPAPIAAPAEALPVAAAPVPAQASPYYLAGRLGVSNLQDIDYRQAVSPGVEDVGSISFDPGIVGAVALGARVMPHVRLEAEVSRLSFSTDEIRAERRTNGVVTSQQTISGGDSGFDAYGFMANAIVDYPVPGAEQIAPYIGAGAGYLVQTNGAEESGFAFQGLAGVEYALPNQTTHLALGYRYMQAPSLLDTPFDFDAESHTLEIGLRQQF